jgi:Protein of unknown function DUF86
MDKHSEFIADNPEIPWRGMRGMRNRVAHGYFGINLDVVWDTTQAALPDLVLRLERLADEPLRIVVHDLPGGSVSVTETLPNILPSFLTLSLLWPKTRT